MFMKNRTLLLAALTFTVFCGVVGCKKEAEKTEAEAQVEKETPGKANNQETVKSPVGKGAVVNAKSKNGKTALMDAAEARDLETVKHLVSQGADVNEKDLEEGVTVLMCAAGTRNNLEMVKYLVSQGADINANGNKGTALMCAAHASDNLETVKYLVSKGADVNAKDKYGRTALDKARDEKVKEYLRSKGARSKVQKAGDLEDLEAELKKAKEDLEAELKKAEEDLTAEMEAAKKAANAQALRKAIEENKAILDKPITADTTTAELDEMIRVIGPLLRNYSDQAETELYRKLKAKYNLVQGEKALR